MNISSLAKLKIKLKLFLTNFSIQTHLELRVVGLGKLRPNRPNPVAENQTKPNLSNLGQLGLYHGFTLSVN